MAVYYASEDKWPEGRWTGEVKAQRPISSTESGPPQLLVYNKNRSLFIHLESTPELLNELFPDKEFRTYRVVSISDRRITWGQAVDSSWI